MELSEGPVKNHERLLGKEVLTAEEGLDKVIECLDSINKEDSSHMAFRAYCRFEKFECQESMNLQAFVSEFAKLYQDRGVRRVFERDRRGVGARRRLRGCRERSDLRQWPGGAAPGKIFN